MPNGRWSSIPDPDAIVSCLVKACQEDHHKSNQMSDFLHGENLTGRNIGCKNQETESMRR